MQRVPQARHSPPASTAPPGSIGATQASSTSRSMHVAPCLHGTSFNSNTGTEHSAAVGSAVKTDTYTTLHSNTYTHDGSVQYVHAYATPMSGGSGNGGGFYISPHALAPPATLQVPGQQGGVAGGGLQPQQQLQHIQGPFHGHMHVASVEGSGVEPPASSSSGVGAVNGVAGMPGVYLHFTPVSTDGSMAAVPEGGVGGLVAPPGSQGAVAHGGSMPMRVHSGSVPPNVQVSGVYLQGGSGGVAGGTGGVPNAVNRITPLQTHSNAAVVQHRAVQSNPDSPAAFLSPPFIPGFANVISDNSGGAGGSSSGPAAAAASASAASGGAGAAARSGGASTTTEATPYWGSFGISGSMKPVVNTASLTNLLTHPALPVDTLGNTQVCCLLAVGQAYQLESDQSSFCSFVIVISIAFAVFIYWKEAILNIYHLLLSSACMSISTTSTYCGDSARLLLFHALSRSERTVVPIGSNCSAR